MTAGSPAPPTSAAAPASLVTRLAAVVHGVDAGQLPAEVVTAAKQRLLDYLSVTLPAPAREEAARVAARFAAEEGGRPEATLLPTGDRTSAAHAAFANAVAGSCLELDDDHAARVGHVGTPTIPAVLAAAERAGATGADVLAGVVAAYETYVRVARGVSPGWLLTRGFQPSGVAGAFGAAAGAARAMRLGPEETRHALALAGSQSSGLIEGTSEGVWTKRFNPGWAAFSGVTAASLARRGFTASAQVLEGARGWYSAYAGAEHADPGAAFADLGSRYEVLGAVTKPYACSRYTHAAIDAARAIRARLGAAGGAPPAVTRVEVETFAHGLGFVAEPAERKRRPRTPVEAQFSMHYAVAVALLDGEALLEQFSPQRVLADDVRSLAGTVRVRVAPDLDALYPAQYPARVTAYLDDGTLLHETVTSPTGDPGHEFTPAQFAQRYTELVTATVPAEQARELWDCVHDLEHVPHVADLVRLATAPQGEAGRPQPASPG